MAPSSPALARSVAHAAAPLASPTVPRTEGTVPRTEGTVPWTEGTVSRTEGTVPRTEGTVSRTEGTVPRTEGTVSVRPAGVFAAGGRQRLAVQTIRAAAAGDGGALDAIARHALQSMVGAACKVLGPGDDEARDAAQEAWCDTDRRRRELAEVAPERINTCLGATAMHAALNVRRTRARRCAVLVTESESASGDHPLETATSPAPDPTDMIAAREIFRQLSHEDQTLLVRHKVEEWTHEEIGRALGCAEGSVRRRIEAMEQRLARLRIRCLRVETAAERAMSICRRI